MQLIEDRPDGSDPPLFSFYRWVACFLISAAAIWLVSVSSIIIFLKFYERSPVEGPWQTGFKFIDGIIKYLSSISNAGFSPFEFLAMGFWSLYLTVFLASLGAVGGLLKLYEGIQALPQKDFSAERRDNILMLVCASVSTAILGSSAVLASVRKKYLLQKFYALEVHLVRFEGLMFSSMSINANHELIDTFLQYMLGYFARIQTLMKDISDGYDFTDQEKIFEDMQKFGGAVKKLSVDGFSAKTETSDIMRGETKVDNTLLGLLRILEFLQEAVRQHIRRLET
jgi:hypothetical protein